jgi:small acid-soluble spore protein N (minor)
MSNQNNQYNQFKNNTIGTQSRGFGGNKGKKMQDKSGHQPQVIQTKGE